jgi:hypothetical protein
MKLVGLVFLGLIASFVISSVAMWAIIKVFPNMAGNDGYMWVPVLIVMPIGFFAGSIVIGHYSYYEIENKWKLLLMAPTLYCNPLWMALTQSGSGFGIVFLMGLYWYLASLAGVGLGYFLRKQFARWWYGD